MEQVSLLPPPAGAAAFLYPNSRFTGLASALDERGYTTVSAVAFDGAFWNRRRTHAAFGITTSLFEEAFEEGEALGWGLNDRISSGRWSAGSLAGLSPFAPCC